LFYFIFLAAIIIDQASKAIIMKTMFLGQSVPIIDRILHLTYIQNPGAAFSLMAGRTNIFIAVSFIVVAAVIIYQIRGGVKRGLIPISLGLIAGGAAGNLLDRVRLGEVVDFIDFRVWPVFNLADSAIVVGAILLAVVLWKSEGKA